MGKIKVLYLDHIGDVDDFVMESGGKARNNIEFCFVGKEKEWENQVLQIGERKVRYDVVILHYSFANLDSRELVKKIRLLLPHARLGIKTGVWGYEDRDTVLGAILVESKPDFCFGPYETDFPLCFQRLKKEELPQKRKGLGDL